MIGGNRQILSVNYDYMQHIVFQGLMYLIWLLAWTKRKVNIPSGNGDFGPPLPEEHLPLPAVQLFEESHYLLVLDLQKQEDLVKQWNQSLLVWNAFGNRYPTKRLGQSGHRY